MHFSQNDRFFLPALTKSWWVFFILFFISPLHAQDQPKNIYELFGLKKGGCSFESLFEESEMVSEIGDGTPIPYPGKVEAPTSREELSLILKEFKKVTANIDDGFDNRQIALKNGTACFKQEEKWGLKNAEGKILLKPQFDYIFSDTLVGGFSGYINGKCNYYDETGKPLLRENYYHISPLDRNTFVVRTLEGVGLILNGKMVVEADKETIQRLTGGNTVYYKIKSALKGEYLLLNDFQTEVPFPAWETAWFSGEDYLVYRNNIFDFKNKRALVCEKDYVFELLDEDQKTASIQRAGDREVYLIDLAGNLTTHQVFTYLGQFNEKGIAMAALRNPGQGRYQLFGLIDRMGQWVLPANYNNIFDIDNYWVIQDADYKTGVLDANGKMILPMEYSFVAQLEGPQVMVTKNTNEGNLLKKESRVINLETGVTLKDGLDYSMLRVFSLCGKKFYLASVQNGEQVLDESFEPVTPIHQRLLVSQGYLIGAGVNNQKRRREKVLYDCEGNVISFNINGQKVDTLSEFNRLEDGMLYITLLDNSNYLVTPKNAPKALDPYINSFAKANLGDFYIVNSFRISRTGMMDAKGNMVLPYQFEYLSPFEADTRMAVFKTPDNKSGLITTKGELFLEDLYDGIHYLGFGLYAVQKDKKYGLVEKSGREILPIEYSYIDQNKGMVRASKGKYFELYDTMGNRVK